MAHWISSKLKAAETLLHQIDQQAAESLGKIEKSSPDTQLDIKISPGVTSETKSQIKDQLKKKVPDYAGNQSIKIPDKPNLRAISRSNSDITRDGDTGTSLDLNSKPQSSSKLLTDKDWTELLSVPVKRGGSRGVNGRQNNNGSLGMTVPKKNGKKVKNFSSVPNSAVVEEKSETGRSYASGPNSAVVEEKTETGRSYGGTKSSRNLHAGFRNNVNADANESVNIVDLTPITSSNHSTSSGSGGQSDQKDSISSLNYKSENGRTKDELNVIADEQKLQPGADSVTKDQFLVILDHVTSNSKMSQRNKSIVKVPSIPSDGELYSETDSTGTSDSEIEREREETRKRRQQILAERAAAKAVKAIQERENLVARLEGEKQSLEKILEEQAKQQVQEASELQASMMEIMEAVELEKQKHNNTRRESFARVAQLESENADLAKSLANAQKNLEVEVYHLAEIRQQADLKETIYEELQRKMSSVQSNGDKLLASKGVEVAMEMLEAEYSFLNDKIGKLEEKGKRLESSISITSKEIDYPTEVEIELKRRLGLFTDHLIKKQAQVETLSSEKATLVFRIETVTKLLEENKSRTYSSDSPTTLEFSNSKFKPLFRDRVQSGQRHLGFLVRQLDSIFCSGAIFLRRNSNARIWCLIYIVCLHLWVIYILTSHSPATDDIRSGAVFSLENINYTGGGV